MSQIDTKEITLHNGLIIPTLGYRVDKDHKEKNIDRIQNAIKAGFRHFDIAAEAEAEKIAGNALKDCGVDRDDLFLTLKLDNENHGYDSALRAFENSMKRLGTDYADLYLINWPNPIKYRDNYEQVAIDTWKALETLYKQGKARAIGVANYEGRHIEFCLEQAEITPMVNQARIYPGFPFEDNLYCANEHAIQTEAFLPPQYEDILNSNELKIFANKYKTTPTAIVTRYHLEKECISLCSGKDVNELKEYFEAFKIDISDEDMKFLDNMKNYGPENINPDTCDF